MSLVTRYTASWAECLEGIVGADKTWCLVPRYRARLLCTLCPLEAGKHKELKERLELWESGDFAVLLERVEKARISQLSAADRN
eukprot:12422703-Karenia_brevis.AAC.1